MMDIMETMLMVGGKGMASPSKKLASPLKKLASPSKSLASPSKRQTIPKSKIVSPTKKGVRAISFSWDKKTTMVLLQLCAEYVSAHGRKQQFRWADIITQFQELTGKHVTVQVLRNRMEIMKKQYQCWCRLKASTGAGWDPVTGRLVNDDVWWDMKIRENSDYKRFRDHGVDLEIEEFWERIFGDSYATGENCVVPGMDCPSDTTSKNLEHESNVLESQLRTPDPDTPMTECDHLVEELARLDPGFFRGSHTSPGEGQTSSTPSSPALASMPSAPKRPSPIPAGGSHSSPLGSSSDGSKRAKLSRAASMFQDVVSELREEGKRTNTLIENLCAVGNFVTPPLTPAVHPPHVVDRVPSIQDAYKILYMMIDEGLLERGSDEFCFAADKILDENNRQGFMFLCSNSDRLAWLKYQMKKNK